MSTGANCRFVQAADGTWTYELQRWPYGASEQYDSYGPFGLFADAEQHLSDYQANPGGYTIRRHPDFDCPHDFLAPLDPWQRKQTGSTHECRRCGRLVVADA